jgi:hypothetical protein
MNSNDRRADDVWQRLVDRRLLELENGQEAFGKQLGENTAVTKAIKEDTADLLEAFRALRWVGAAVKWLAGLAAAALTAWFAWKQLK